MSEIMLDRLKTWVRAKCRLGCRGGVAITFAVSLFPLVLCISTAVDMSRIAVARANLQTAVDDAALSGAAAYSKNASSFQTLALSIATISFCDAADNLPDGFALVGSGTANGATAEVCATNPGPSVSAITASYTQGTIGYASNPACSTALQATASFTCAFVVTVSGTVTIPTLVPAIFGATHTVSVTGVAANPFLNFAKVFSGTTIASGAKYANSVWVYPLLLNANGQPNYTSNPGALPDNTTCLSGNGPDSTTCGAGSAGGGSVSGGLTSAITTTVNYVMLANTEYANGAIGAAAFTSPVSGVTYVGGVVQNPETPPGVTATTPLGVAFQTIAGGNLFYGSATELTNPGVYGYDVVSPGGSPQYITSAYNGCTFPYDNLANATIGQVWQTTTSGPTTTVSPLLPWSTVTHWFYSSYLANPSPQPPDYLEISSQATNNEVVYSVPQDPAQYGGNIGGKATYNANATQQAPNTGKAVTTMASKCLDNLSSTPTQGVTYQTSTYPTISTNNCSVFVAQSTTPGTPTPTPPQYDGECFAPASTPGAQYAALNCQSYGSGYYFFYWNDMGGAQFDNINYEADSSSYTTQFGVGEGPQTTGDGTVVLHCASGTHVVLVE